MNSNPTVHFFKPSIDCHLDPLENSEIPSCDEERLVEYYDTTHSNNRNKTDEKLSHNSSSRQNENEKNDIVILGVA